MYYTPTFSLVLFPILCLSFLSPTLPPVSPLPLCHSHLPSNPSPLLCLSFLSPTFPPVSPLPLFHFLSSLLLPCYFASFIPFTNTPTYISPPRVSLFIFPFAPLLLCVLYSFYQVGEYISLGICVSQVREHISLGISHITRDMCFP